MNNSNRIFELYCEFQVDIGCVEPRITKIYPQNYSDDEVLRILGDFVFPSVRTSSPIKAVTTEKSAPTSFSFVLTNINKQYKYGFTRQHFTEDSKIKAIVILTLHPWHDVFLKFINVLSTLRHKPNITERQFDSYLAYINRKSLPDEHKMINLVFSDANGIILQEFSFKRPLSIALPSIPENHNLNLFYNYIEPKTMIQVFAALLTERRIIFISSNIDKLSSCVQASCSLLYPMYWQHIFIPLLPLKLKDYLLAPMPYCIGCPASVFEAVRREEIGEVVLINCDTNVVQSPFDDVNDLPQDILSFLKKNLTGSSCDLRGDRIPRIFLSSLVQIIGGYRDAIKYTEKGVSFSNEMFIESQLPQYKPFVQKIVELQVFQQFIEERLALLVNGAQMTDIFEIEVELHEAKMGKKTNQYKEFIKNIKGKANPAMKNAVKSVKETCKELKSKIRENSNRDTFSVKKPEKPKYRETLQIYESNISTFQLPTYADSPSTSSGSSPSDMNILQELEAQGILNTSSLSSGSSKNHETVNECNLIDLSSDGSCDNIAKFNQLALNNENKKTMDSHRFDSSNRDPFGSSELLSDVMSELYKANKNNWTTFE